MPIAPCRVVGTIEKSLQHPLGTAWEILPCTDRRNGAFAHVSLLKDLHKKGWPEAVMLSHAFVHLVPTQRCCFLSSEMFICDCGGFSNV